jgi:hypothetical protein
MTHHAHPSALRLTARGALLALTLIAAPATALPAFAQQPARVTIREVPMPTVAGPIGNDGFDSPGNFYTFFATDIALASHGYVEEEYFLSGTASIYDAPGTSPAVAPSTLARVVGDTVPYRTRMVVRRPSDPADFNGTVLVEWINTSDGFDGEYFWVQTHKHVVRDGYVYVGLSAQDQSMSHAQFGLKTFSPTRYGTLDVTGGGAKCCGDAETAHDIFAQAGRAVRSHAGVLRGLTVRNVIGIGMSQSGRRMSVYANYVHLGAPVYDAFLFQVHNSPLRDDLGVPVIKVLSESEYDNRIEKEYDTDLRKSYWVAGTSHGDILQRTGRNGVRLRDLGLGLTPNDACGPTGPLGERMTRTRTPLAHVLNAAVHHLKAHIERRTPLPSAVAATWAASPAWVERDPRGNALGGIQLAAMVAPTARADGLECGNIGVWEPFTVDQLKSLYPSHGEYVSRVRQAVAATVTAGFVLPEDGAETVAEAEASVVGTGLTCGTYCVDRSHYRVDFASTGTLRHTTDYYNIAGGRALMAAAAAAHRHVAEGDSAEGPQRAQYYALATHRLREYLALLDDARRDERVTATASDVLAMQAQAIITGLAGSATTAKE